MNDHDQATSRLRERAEKAAARRGRLASFEGFEVGGRKPL